MLLVRRFVRSVVLAALFSAVPLCAQNPVPPAQKPQSPVPSISPDSREPRDEDMEREMQKKRNQERQASLKRDTDQLLKLATELKQQVDKTNENLLSLDVVRKAEEIEKLAHSVRAKMKN